ncbi:laccase 8 [Coprinellus micaceus]|uniref:Laccase 8 n=1 Tax=Coprinellus micaceus TaxID=71717 RepID=A0A4Y7TUC0_COPMI|nr:laccase 8 [Coprinellus micaceus]
MFAFSRLLSATFVSAVLSSILASADTLPSLDGTQATLVISNQNLSPDGFERPVTLANGIHPGPIIKAHRGDLLQINLVNNMTDPTQYRGTSIHWHGMFQHTTNYEDGVAGVNQCPIGPGDSFLYQFSTTNQAGTYWYHSHYRTQYCDGLRGPLIIYDHQDPFRTMYDVDDESTIITLADWYHLQSPSITGIAAADATLINGQGRYEGGPAVDLAVLNVVAGKRYRIRLINMACDPDFLFSIDGHDLTVIEADGNNVQPVVVNQIHILAGQRYSAILTANQAVDNYWLRALPNDGAGNLPNTFDGGLNSAIVRYAGAPSIDPTSAQQDPFTPLDETTLHPLVPQQVPGAPYPGGADVNLNLALSFDFDAWRFYINGLTFNPPSIPVLLQILSGEQVAQNLLPQGQVYSIPKNATVEISIPGGLISSPHPFHLHGHSFFVVKSAGTDTDYNYANPVRRDVVNTGDLGSNVTIRFRADNAGPWFLHCHIDWHLDLGLAMVLAVDIEDASLLNQPPPAWDDLCPIYNNEPLDATAIQTVATPTTPGFPPPTDP